MNAPNPAAQGVNTGQIDAMNKAAQASGGGLFMGVQEFFGRLGGAVQQGVQWAKANMLGKGGQADLGNISITKHLGLGQNLSPLPGIGGRSPKPLNMAANFEGMVPKNLSDGLGGGSAQSAQSVPPTSLPMNGNSRGLG